MKYNWIVSITVTFIISSCSTYVPSAGSGPIGALVSLSNSLILQREDIAKNPSKFDSCRGLVKKERIDCEKTVQSMTDAMQKSKVNN